MRIDGERLASWILFSLFTSIMIILIWAIVFIVLPQETKKRDFMLKNPHYLVMSEWQRGGQLPSIPEINVNMKRGSDERVVDTETGEPSD